MPNGLRDTTASKNRPEISLIYASLPDITGAAGNRDFFCIHAFLSTHYCCLPFPKASECCSNVCSHPCPSSWLLFSCDASLASFYHLWLLGFALSSSSTGEMERRWNKEKGLGSKNYICSLIGNFCYLSVFLTPFSIPFFCMSLCVIPVMLSVCLYNRQQIVC